MNNEHCKTIGRLFQEVRKRLPELITPAEEYTYQHKDTCNLFNCISSRFVIIGKAPDILQMNIIIIMRNDFDFLRDYNVIPSFLVESRPPNCCKSLKYFIEKIKQESLSQFLDMGEV